MSKRGCAVTSSDIPALYDLADASQYEYEDMAGTLDKFVQEIQGPIYRGLLLPKVDVKENAVIEEWRNSVSHWTTDARTARYFAAGHDECDIGSMVDYLEETGVIPTEKAMMFWHEGNEELIREYFDEVILVLRDVPPAIPLYQLLLAIMADNDLSEAYQAASQSGTPTELEKLVGEHEITLHGYDFRITEIHEEETGLLVADVIAEPYAHR